MQQSQSFDPAFAQAPSGAALTFQRVGRAVALTGVIAPLLLIGGMKFTQVEIEGLKPLIGGTPWLAWMYPVLRRGRRILSARRGRDRDGAALDPLAVVGAGRHSGRRYCGLHLPRHLLDHVRAADLGSDSRISGTRAAWAVPDQGYRPAGHLAGRARRGPGPTQPGLTARVSSDCRRLPAMPGVS